MTVIGSRASGGLAPSVIALTVLLTAETAAGDPPSGADATTAKPSTTEAEPGNGPAVAAPQEAKPEANPPAPENIAPIESDEAVPILGKKVRGPDGKDIMGPVIDVLVDGDGRPRAAIIDFGGFLGVGSRKIAVDWQALKFRPADHDAPLLLSLDRSEIQAAPEYKDPTKPAEVVVEPPAAPAVTDAEKPAN